MRVESWLNIHNIDDTFSRILFFNLVFRADATWLEWLDLKRVEQEKAEGETEEPEGPKCSLTDWLRKKLANNPRKKHGHDGNASNQD